MDSPTVNVYDNRREIASFTFSSYNMKRKITKKYILDKNYYNFLLVISNYCDISVPYYF